MVLLGEFGRPHGLSGEVRLKSYTADPSAIGSYGPLATVDGRTVEIGTVRPAAGAPGDMLVVRVKGVGGREAAEALNRLRLYAPRERLGEPEPDEFFAADLVGLDAVDPQGHVLGRIAAVPNYGGGDLLEIARPRGPSVLVPFTRVFVPEIDVGARRVVVDAPADLFEG